ncbi:MAG TPA: histidine kinase [Thermomicrobiales bacterium]|nr:histidine kinase [Thermomicrobiales bacterium]
MAGRAAIAEPLADGRAAEAAGVAAGARGQDADRVLPRRLWQLFSLVWLFFLAFPIAGLLQGHARPTALLGGLAGMALFVACYLWLMLSRPFQGATLAPAALRLRLAVLAVLAATVFALALTQGIEWLWFVSYAGLAAGVALSPRAAVWATAALMLLAAATGLGIAAGLDTGRFVVLAAAGGFGMLGVGRLLDTIGELRAAREELARLAVAEERLRFARDLHDLLGHSLTEIALKSELAGRLVSAAPERAAREIGDVERAARAALREVREAVAGYRQPALAEELAGARELLAAAGIQATISQTAGPLPPAADAALAWAVREGVTNVLRHSRARRCAIEVAREENTLSAAITDDGRGAPPAGGPGGNGLAGLTERAAALGGRVAAGPLAGGGFRLRVELPADTPAREGSR